MSELRMMLELFFVLLELGLEMFSLLSFITDLASYLCILLCKFFYFMSEFCNLVFFIN